MQTEEPIITSGLNSNFYYRKRRCIHEGTEILPRSTCLNDYERTQTQVRFSNVPTNLTAAKFKDKKEMYAVVNKSKENNTTQMKNADQEDTIMCENDELYETVGAETKKIDNNVENCCHDTKFRSEKEYENAPPGKVKVDGNVEKIMYENNELYSPM